MSEDHVGDSEIRQHFGPALGTVVARVRAVSLHDLAAGYVVLDIAFRVSRKDGALGARDVSLPRQAVVTAS